MSEMDKLLVSGCSYTDNYWTIPNMPSRPARPGFDKTHRLAGFPIWPDLFGVKVTNLAKCGLGNDYILNSIVDRVSIEKFDFVIAMWTEFARVDFEFNDNEYKHEKLPWTTVQGEGKFLLNTSKLSTDFDGTLIYHKPFNYELFVKRALRTFYIFQQVMENMNIPYLQVAGCRSMPISLNNNIAKFIINSPIVDKIDYRRFVGWPIFPEIGGWCMDDKLDELDPSRTELRIGGGDNHPNEEGHRHIFNILMENMS